MKRSRNLLIFILALFLLLGSLPAAADLRPFGLSGAGNLTFTGNPPPDATLTASGIATHLGRWTAVGELTFGTPEGPLVPASGTETFTAADGDELHAEVIGELDTTTGIATGVFRFVGGTGRFEDASGSAEFVVVQDPSGTFEVTAIGTIDF
jgi:hypothetical protein